MRSLLAKLPGVLALLGAALSVGVLAITVRSAFVSDEVIWETLESKASAADGRHGMQRISELFFVTGSAVAGVGGQVDWWASFDGKVKAETTHTPHRRFGGRGSPCAAAGPRGGGRRTDASAAATRSTPRPPPRIAPSAAGGWRRFHNVFNSRRRKPRSSRRELLELVTVSAPKTGASASGY